MDFGNFIFTRPLFKPYSISYQECEKNFASLMWKNFLHFRWKQISCGRKNRFTFLWENLEMIVCLFDRLELFFYCGFKICTYHQSIFSCNEYWKKFDCSIFSALATLQWCLKISNTLMQGHLKIWNFDSHWFSLNLKPLEISQKEFQHFCN